MYGNRSSSEMYSHRGAVPVEEIRKPISHHSTTYTAHVISTNAVHVAFHTNFVITYHHLTLIY